MPYGCLGRADELDELKKLLEREKKPVVVRGVAGVGKTALCSYYYNEQCTANEQYIMPFINITGCAKKSDFYNAVCAGLNIQNKDIVTLNQLIRWIIEHKSKYHVLYFDNWEDLQCALSGTDDWNEICKFVLTLSMNNIKVLISSQEHAPTGWRELPLGVLSPKNGRILFKKLLSFRGKNTKNMSREEKKALEYLLIVMDNHPLTLVLTASLIDGENDNLVRIKKCWNSAYDDTAFIRHRSLEVALKLSYDTVSKTKGAVELWGIISKLSNDFPNDFFKFLSTDVYKESEWEKARRSLSKRSLISYEEGGKSLRMLLPIKLQWSKLTNGKRNNEIIKLWGNMLPEILENSDASRTHNPEKSNLLKQEVFLCMKDFMNITNELLKSQMKVTAGQCIELMGNYYELIGESAFSFLSELPSNKFSDKINGMIKKFQGDISRMRDRDMPDKAQNYYNCALSYFEKSNYKIGLAEVLNNIGQNYYWNFNNPGEAMNFLKESELLSRNINYLKGVGETLKNQGIIYTNHFKDYEHAQKCYDEAKKYYESIDDYIGIAHVIKRSGVILWNVGRYSDAVEKYNCALKYYSKAHYIQGQCDTLSRLCIGYIKLNNIPLLKKTIKKVNIYYNMYHIK